MISETAPDAGAEVHRFVWVVEGEPVRGGQWMAFSPEGHPRPVALAEAVAASRLKDDDSEPLAIHVQAARQIIDAAGELEDRLFPNPANRLHAALASLTADRPQIDPDSAEGSEVRMAAEALEKLAADMAELVEETLDSGSLADLPESTTHALCQTIQAGWRLRPPPRFTGPDPRPQTRSARMRATGAPGILKIDESDPPVGGTGAHRAAAT